MEIHKDIQYNQGIGKYKALSSTAGVGSIVTTKAGFFIMPKSVSYWGFVRDVNDFVSWAPRIIMPYSGLSYGFSADTHWNKYGNSYWFSKQNWSNTVSADPMDIGKTHIQNLYLDFLRNEPELDTFKKRNEASKYIS